MPDPYTHAGNGVAVPQMLLQNEPPLPATVISQLRYSPCSLMTQCDDALSLACEQDEHRALWPLPLTSKGPTAQCPT